MSLWRVLLADLLFAGSCVRRHPGLTCRVPLLCIFCGCREEEAVTKQIVHKARIA